MCVSVCLCVCVCVCVCVHFLLSVSYDDTFTGNAIFDQMVSMFLSTSPFVGGIVGLVLDNTLPGQCSMTSKAHHLDILEKPNVAFKSPASRYFCTNMYSPVGNIFVKNKFRNLTSQLDTNTLNVKRFKSRIACSMMSWHRFILWHLVCRLVMWWVFHIKIFALFLFLGSRNSRGLPTPQSRTCGAAEGDLSVYHLPRPLNKITRKCPVLQRLPFLPKIHRNDWNSCKICIVKVYNRLHYVLWLQLCLVMLPHVKCCHTQ